MSVRLVIPGRPRPGERAGTTPEGGRYPQTNTKRIKADVGAAWTARPERHRSPTLTGPVAVWITAVYPRPSDHLLAGGGLSAAGLRSPLPTSTRADLDNLAKPILDALTGLAWRDDHQVCDLVVRKRWDDDEGPRTEVRISPMAEPLAPAEDVAA